MIGKISGMPSNRIQPIPNEGYRIHIDMDGIDMTATLMEGAEEMCWYV